MSGLLSPSAVNSIDELDYSMGMVTFATLLFMLHTDSYDIDWHPRTWVRSMIYLDALAFFLTYLSDLIQDSCTCTFFLAIKIAGEVFWSFKDGLKYGFIIYRGFAIMGNKRQWPIYATLVVSVGLYSYYIFDKYSEYMGSELDCIPIPPEPYMSLIYLYSFWSLIEIGISGVIVVKMSLSLARVKRMNFAIETYSRYKKREENRLLVACVGMLGVTILTIAHYVSQTVNGNKRQPLPIQINRLVFVTMQLLLLLGSASGSWRTDGNVENAFDDRDGGIGDNVISKR
ncbi:hypothetical protein BDR26DRAFT_855705 [Obelidium mucronatum]|nr:hypothetical protein BDR26DRAFT_855705 [Obelidium mucronatum]